MLMADNTTVIVGSTDADIGSNTTELKLEDVSTVVSPALSEEEMPVDDDNTTNVGSTDADVGSNDTRVA